MAVVTWSATLLILSHAAIASAAQPARGEAIVQVGIFTNHPDGSSGSAAYDTEPGLESQVYASGKLCQLGAGYRQAPAWAMHAWRFSGRVVNRTPDEAVVQLTWQRTLDSGTEIVVPENTVRLTLRAGDRVQLDTVHAASDSPCFASVTFEARFTPRRSDAASPVAGGGGAGQSGSQARGVDGTGAGGPGVRAGNDGVSAFQTGRRQSWMHVNLWLVHTAPDRKEEVVHQLVRSPQDGASFAFAPISIETPRGPVVVQVSGSFGVADGQLVFVTNRHVKYSQSPRGQAQDIQGTGRTVNALPRPDEVLSFEMPPIAGAPGAAALPNMLSLRVQIAR